MKVLITHELFAPDFAGGGEYVVLHVARGLMQSGVDVRVLTTGNPDQLDYEGIPTIRLPMHRYRMNLAAGKIAKWAQDVDLIQTFNYHACLPSLIAGKRVNKPVVCLILGLFRDAWKQMRGPIAARAWMAWEKYLITRDFTRMIFLSDYSREQGIAMGVSSERSIVNEPGIELHEYGPAAQKEDVVLFVGKYDVRKGVFDILEVAKRLPRVRFRMFGWGDDEARLRSTASSNVEFVRFERGKPLYAQFAKARIFLLPSKAETFGIALLEAMASGCAVISTIPLTFHGQQITGNINEMTAAIERLWSDRSATEQMGAKNIELAQSFTWQRHTARLLELYNEVLIPPLPRGGKEGSE